MSRIRSDILLWYGSWFGIAITTLNYIWSVRKGASSYMKAWQR